MTHPVLKASGMQRRQAPQVEMQWLRQLNEVLLMAATFSCPVTTWIIFKGYMSVSDAFFIAAFTVFVVRNRGFSVSGDVLLLLLMSGVVLVLSGLITFAIRDIYNSPANAFKQVVAMTLAPLAIALIASADRDTLEKLLFAWFAGAVFSALVAYTTRHGIWFFGLGDAAIGTGGRAQGLSYHSNAFAYTSALLVPVAVYLWIKSKGLFVRGLLAVGLFLLIYAIDLSGSRAALLALTMGLLPWLFLFVNRNRLPLIIFVLMGLATGTLLVITIMIEFDLGTLVSSAESAISRFLGLSETTQTSNMERRWSIDYCWAQFVEHPLFGVGYETIRFSHVHILGILYAGGLFGLLGFIFWSGAIFIALYRVLFLLWVESQATWARLLLVLVLSGLIIWFVAGALQPLLTDRNGYLLVGVLFALDVHARRQIRAIQNERARGASPGSVVGKSTI